MRQSSGAPVTDHRSSTSFVPSKSAYVTLPKISSSLLTLVLSVVLLTACFYSQRTCFILFHLTMENDRRQWPFLLRGDETGVTVKRSLSVHFLALSEALLQSQKPSQKLVTPLITGESSVMIEIDLTFSWTTATVLKWQRQMYCILLMSDFSCTSNPC